MLTATVTTPPAPLLTGGADRVIDMWLEGVLNSYAADGLAEIGYWMDHYFKHPTPYYETQVVVDRASKQRVIHDSGVIYGPWLAGVGSRNATSRFKGYAHWRRTKAYLAGQGGAAILKWQLPQLEMALVGGR